MNIVNSWKIVARPAADRRQTATRLRQFRCRGPCCEEHTVGDAGCGEDRPIRDHERDAEQDAEEQRDGAVLVTHGGVLLVHDWFTRVGSELENWL